MDLADNLNRKTISLNYVEKYFRTTVNIFGESIQQACEDISQIASVSPAALNVNLSECIPNIENYFKFADRRMLLEAILTCTRCVMHFPKMKLQFY